MSIHNDLKIVINQDELYILEGNNKIQRYGIYDYNITFLIKIINKLYVKEFEMLIRKLRIGLKDYTR